MKLIPAYLIIILFLSQSVYGYEPQTVHKPLALSALKIYSKCFPDKKLFVSEESRLRVLEGDVAMDEGLGWSIGDRVSLKDESVFFVAKRTVNWHFFNPSRADYARIGFIDQSHQRLWDGLHKGFISNEKPYNKLLFVGGLFHFVEDFTVPAHVVPVYHGPNLVKFIGPKRFAPLVNYMSKEQQGGSFVLSDKIDVFKPDIERLESELQDDMSLCSRVAESVQTLDEIREETVNLTLAKLGEDIPRCAGLTWQGFWVKPKGEDYFGRYQLENNSPLFSEAGVLKITEHGEACEFEADDKRYMEFVFELHKQAIKSDLKVLSWADKEIALGR